MSTEISASRIVDYIERGGRKATMLYAMKGEIVTCSSGHSICEIARDIYRGETAEVKQFKNWDPRYAKEPESNDEFTPCLACGSQYLRRTGIRFKNGWRR